LYVTLFLKLDHIELSSSTLSSFSFSLTFDIL
jgi:hypothetical protein